MSPPKDPSEVDLGTCIETWGEIANYLNISVRAAQIWEKHEGLPIHREGGRVLAYAKELDQWRHSRRHAPVPVLVEPLQPGPDPLIAETGREVHDRTLRTAGKISIATFLLVAAILCWPVVSRWTLPEPRATFHHEDVKARLFVVGTSESHSWRKVPLPDSASFIEVAPGGDEVYLAAIGVPRITIVDAATLTARIVDLPTPVSETIRPTLDGRSVLLGSSTDGFMLFNRGTGKIEHTVLTGSPVSDVVFAARRNTYYVAMMHQGVHRYRSSDRSLKRLTREGCPYFIDIDSHERFLLVSYQCGGPTGRDGHDAIELIDLESEKSVVVASGPPLVGGPHRFSPDSTLAWLNGWDACRTAGYDHVGCPFVPGDVFHVFRIADQRFIKTLEFPPKRGGQPHFFPDGSRVFLDQGMHVVETARFTAVETYPMPSQVAGALAPDGKKAYVVLDKEKELNIFEAEPPECSFQGPGSIHLLTGDGTGFDSIQNAVVDPPGSYQPGRVGQAFSFDGHERSLIRSSSSFRFGIGDSTLALYVKPAKPAQFGTLLEWMGDDRKQGWRLSVDENRFVLFDFVQRGANPIRLQSRTRLPQIGWTHVAVTKTQEALRLFLDAAESANDKGPGSPFRFDHFSPYRLGFSGETGSVAFRGLIDEIALWARALPAEEIRALYERRLHGPCKI